MTEGRAERRAAIRRFDPAEYLNGVEELAAFLTAALETGDAEHIQEAIGIAARARGMSEVASAAHVSRENLYRALSRDTATEFGTIVKVLSALNVRLVARPRLSGPSLSEQEDVMAYENVWDALEDTQEAAAHMALRSELMSELVRVVRGWNVSQAEAAARLHLTQPRVSDLLRGRISQFSLDALVVIAARAHMRAHVRLEA